MKKILLSATLFCSISSLFSQQWDTLAPVPEALTFAVAAVADGKIHVMGGGGTGGATNNHYAYDPATDVWSPRADVPYLAQQPAGAAVNGKIHYFGGGYPNTGTPLDDHHIYDPTTDNWALAADLTAPRAIHYGVGLDGVLFSLGGQGMANLCQTYDAVNNSWITKNNLPDNSFWYGAHVPTGGSIYRFCGGGYTAPVNKAHKYNAANDSWAVLPNTPNAVHAIRGAAIGDKIFLAGGYFDFLDRDEVWIFDTQTETYSPGIPMPIGRSYHNLVALDSCIYAIGGNNAIDETVRTQLIRLCPFETPSTLIERPLAQVVSASYHKGKLQMQLPEHVEGPAHLNLFDTMGRLVFTEKMFVGPQGLIETWPGPLPQAVYFVQVKTDYGIFIGKVVSQ